MYQRPFNVPKLGPKQFYHSSRSLVLVEPPRICKAKTRPSSQAIHHPLDRLTVEDILRVQSISDRLRLQVSLQFFSLHELEKLEVLAWDCGGPLPPQRAFVLAFSNGQTHELVVHLGSGRVEAHSIEVGSGYPPLTLEDLAAALKVPFTSAEFNESILAWAVRPSDVKFITPSAGWYGRAEEEEQQRRVIKVQCFDQEGTSNFYMRPLEGITMMVDIDKREIVLCAGAGVGLC